GIHKAELQYRVAFDNVTVPAESILGEEGAGIRVLFDSLNPERLVVAAANVGSADYVLKKAVEYANVRAPFDTPIGSYQSVQHPLAIAKVNIEAARSLMYKAAAQFDAGENAAETTSMTKYLASIAFRQATDAAANVYGGAFTDMEQDILGFFLQAKLTELGPINNNIILSQIASKVLGLPRGY
ncbi:MAG: acyl-CoA dehydrogenase, partial [Alphaproteobacteria bacterium]